MSSPSRPLYRDDEGQSTGSAARPVAHDGAGLRELSMSLVQPASDSGGSARRREKRFTDEEIVEHLRRLGFDRGSRLWRGLAEQLVGYAYPLLVGWAVSGVLGQRVAESGSLSRGRVPRDLQLSVADAEDLAVAVVSVSIERFRTKSLPQWDPAGGASLRTFFVRRTLLDVGDVYGAWQHVQGREEPMDPEDLPAAGQPVGGVAGGVADHDRSMAEVENRLLAEEVLDLADDPVARRMVELQAQGYRIEEIAQELGRTPGAVRTMLHRFRKALRRRAKEKHIDG